MHAESDWHPTKDCGNICWTDFRASALLVAKPPGTDPEYDGYPQ